MSNDILVDDEASYTETTKINDNASNDIAPNDTYTVIMQLKTSDTKPNGTHTELFKGRLTPSHQNRAFKAINGAK